MIKKYICLLLYYGFARYLPDSSSKCGGRISNTIRLFLCRRIFKSCGKNVNIHRLATFGKGFEIEIGDNSDLGVNCVVPNNIIIGNNVMMAPNCYILSAMHNTESLEIPMIMQGSRLCPPPLIEDDVWIGRNVMMTPSRHIKKGSIIAMGCVLTKDFPEYSIVGGNPSKLIRNRKENKQQHKLY